MSSSAGQSKIRVDAYDKADMHSILTVETVEALLTAQNFSMPAGYVTEEGIDYLVRVGDKFQSVDEMKELVLLDMEGIDPVKLSDVAGIEVVNNADETYAKINGKPGVMLSIQKQTGYSARHTRQPMTAPELPCRNWDLSGTIC